MSKEAVKCCVKVRFIYQTVRKYQATMAVFIEEFSSVHEGECKADLLRVS